MGKFDPLRIILDILFPPRCTFCGKLLKQGEKEICRYCQEQLPWITGDSSVQKFEFISKCVSPLWYRDRVRESIHRFKFRDRSGYAKVYGKLLAQSVSDHLMNQYDLITWVPLSQQGMKKRGYDQAMLLAMATALSLDHAAVETLRKVRNTDTQSHLDEDAARRANVLGAYEVTDQELIVGKRILLIDDVVTTGSTLSECARVLRMFGAEDVLCATLARARK